MRDGTSSSRLQTPLRTCLGCGRTPATCCRSRWWPRYVGGTAAGWPCSTVRHRGESCVHEHARRSMHGPSWARVGREVRVEPFGSLACCMYHTSYGAAACIIRHMGGQRACTLWPQTSALHLAVWGVCTFDLWCHAQAKRRIVTHKHGGNGNGAAPGGGVSCPPPSPSTAPALALAGAVRVSRQGAAGRWQGTCRSSGSSAVPAVPRTARSQSY